MTIRLTGEQLYWQAVRKVRIRADRQRREFLAGKIGILPCTRDAERREIIKVMDRLLHAQDQEA